jgi:hypothetical protein
MSLRIGDKVSELGSECTFEHTAFELIAYAKKCTLTLFPFDLITSSPYLKPYAKKCTLTRVFE